MTKIYLVRHCEAEGNAKRFFQGAINTDITELGEKQLEILSEQFKDIHIDRVYSSPLLRAVKTAKAAVKGKNLEVIHLEGLTEVNGGFLEGKPFFESFEQHPDLADTWNNHPQDFFPSGGEPMWEAYERIWNTITALANKHKGKTLLLSTHGGVLRCLNCRFMYGDISHLKDTPWADNTAISLLEFDEYMTPRFVFSNDASHLPDELNPKRSRLTSIVKGTKEEAE